jgi:hypothetical protein
MTITTEQALEQALAELAALSPKELRAELDKHKDGPLATALREAGDFLYNHDPDKPVEQETK